MNKFLAFGICENRAVVRGNDTVIEQQMSVNFTSDHRYVDERLGAELFGAY